MSISHTSNPLDTIYFWKTIDKYGLFSQWFISEFSIELVKFNCCEQYMMWSKAMLFNDTQTACKIMLEKIPRKQKSLGRKVKNFNPTIWEQNRERIVCTANYAKFTQNIRLEKILLSTEDKIICEASPNDSIWGIGTSEKNAKQGAPWKGQNLLGNAIMSVRDIIKKEKYENETL